MTRLEGAQMWKDAYRIEAERYKRERDEARAELVAFGFTYAAAYFRLLFGGEVRS